MRREVTMSITDTSLVPLLSELEKLFDILNEHFYDSKLETPVIITNSYGKKKAFGWCTSWRAWNKASPNVLPLPSNVNTEDGYYEINICSEYLQRPFEEIAETMLHEMVHLYNLQLGIQDCSRGGTYHNNRFRDQAEDHGLMVEKVSGSGWAGTSLNDKALEFILGLKGEISFDLQRHGDIKKETKKTSVRKYGCPHYWAYGKFSSKDGENIGCDCMIRATKEVFVKCGRHDLPLIYQDSDDEDNQEITRLAKTYLTMLNDGITDIDLDELRIELRQDSMDQSAQNADPASQAS